jgi:TRAP-type C4-dicarboxylate transport system permease small subunit
VTEAGPGEGWLARADRLGRIVENAALCVLLGVMIVLAATQIVLRNAVGEGIGWADGVLRLLVLWVGLLGAIAASREDRHLAVDVLSHYLPNAARQRLAFVVDAVTSVVCFTLAWLSGEFVLDSWRSGEQLAALLPAWVAQLILHVAFFLMGYRYAVWAVRRPRLARAAAGRRA